MCNKDSSVYDIETPQQLDVSQNVYNNSIVTVTVTNVIDRKDNEEEEEEEVEEEVRDNKVNVEEPNKTFISDDESEKNNDSSNDSNSDSDSDDGDDRAFINIKFVYCKIGNRLFRLELYDPNVISSATNSNSSRSSKSINSSLLSSKFIEIFDITDRDPQSHHHVVIKKRKRLKH